MLMPNYYMVKYYLLTMRRHIFLLIKGIKYTKFVYIIKYTKPAYNDSENK